MTNCTRRDSMKLLLAGAATIVAPSSSIGQPPSTRPALAQRLIPSTGEPLPVIGLGTYQTFDVSAHPLARAPIEAVLAAFVELGGQVIDSSPMYARAETVAGDLLSKFGIRDRLFVATKVWTDGKQAGIEQMRASLKKLNADPIDLMQVHNLRDVDNHLATIADWKAEGRVRYVGVTHYTAGGQRAIAKLLETKRFDFVQVNYNVVEREAEDRLLPLCRDSGIAVIINRPFAGGETLRRLANRPVPDFANALECTTWAQLLLKFVVSHPAVTCAIPATSKVSHIRSNMAAGRGPMPDQALRDAIFNAARG